MIDGPGAELDRQRDRTLLGELIAVQAKSEPRGTASLEVAASLVDVERPLLEKDIRARGQPRSFRQDFGEREASQPRSRDLGRERPLQGVMASKIQALAVRVGRLRNALT